MARQNGRDIIIRDASDDVIAVANVTVTVNNSAVDVTRNDDQGFVTVLSRPGTKQISLSGGGATEDNTLLTVAVSGANLLAAYSVEFLNDAGSAVAYTIAGNWFLSSYVETGNHDGAREFTLELATSGAFTGTAAP